MMAIRQKATCIADHTIRFSLIMEILPVCQGPWTMDQIRRWMSGRAAGGGDLADCPGGSLESERVCVRACVCVFVCLNKLD